MVHFFFFFCLYDNLFQIISVCASIVCVILSLRQISLQSQQNKIDTRKTFATIGIFFEIKQEHFSETNKSLVTILFECDESISKELFSKSSPKFSPLTTKRAS